MLNEQVGHANFNACDIIRNGLVHLRCYEMTPPRGGSDAYFMLIPFRDGWYCRHVVFVTAAATQSRMMCYGGGCNYCGSVCFTIRRGTSSG